MAVHEGALPGLVVDLADISCRLPGDCEQRGQLGVEVDPVLPNGDGLVLAQSGRRACHGVRGLAVAAVVDVAHREGDGFAGAGPKVP